MSSPNTESVDYVRMFRAGKPVVIQFQKLAPTEMENVRKMTEMLLEEKNLNKFFAFASTVIKEFLQNGVKATQKRIFFKNHGFDIDKNHKMDVEKFKESISNGDIHNHQLIDGIDFMVELKIQEYENGLLISVRNHGEMNENEIKNVNFMIDRGRKTNEVSDLLSDETSNKEGGGLGLSMIVILMKKLGLTPDCLFYEVKNSFTSFNVKIPYNI